MTLVVRKLAFVASCVVEIHSLAQDDILYSVSL